MNIQGKQQHGEFDFYKVTQNDLQDLFSIALAEITFLRGEYSSLLVKSSFNDETCRLFKNLESNQASFSEKSLQNVRIAAELASIQSRQANPWTRPRGRGRGRFQTARQDDVFSSFTRRNPGQFSRRDERYQPQERINNNNRDTNV